MNTENAQTAISSEEPEERIAALAVERELMLRVDNDARDSYWSEYMFAIDNALEMAREELRMSNA